MTTKPTANFILRQSEILRLKSTMGENGKPMDFGQIGRKLGLSKNGAFYYLSRVREGRCPCHLDFAQTVQVLTGQPRAGPHGRRPSFV